MECGRSQVFNIEFTKADYLSGVGQKAFIAELMPRHPLYVDMLPDDAKAAIGIVHPNTRPAYNLLLEEGLRYKGYIDIFDGGATLQADIENLRAIKESQSVTVQIEQPQNIAVGMSLTLWPMMIMKIIAPFLCIASLIRTYCS